MADRHEEDLTYIHDDDVGFGDFPPKRTAPCGSEGEGWVVLVEKKEDRERGR